MSPSNSSATADRLPRMLALVPYLLARPGIRIVEVAEEFGVTEAQLRKDLDLLFVCGLPGYGPGDLIDMVLDDETVTITYDAGMDRPLRLTADEALALIVALRALEETPALSDRGAVERALSKLESAAGDAAEDAGRVAIRLGTTQAVASRADALHGALERRRAVRIVYYTAARDATTERVVDPIRLLAVEGRHYLEGWCRRAEAVRRFRLDRIDALTELDEPAAPPNVPVEEVDFGVFRPGPDAVLITLELRRPARWITEYFPMEQVADHPDGTAVAHLWATDLQWARRLVLGQGTNVTVLSPPELAEAVRSDARTALAAYAGA